MIAKSARIGFRMERLSISRDRKATHFAGVNSMAQPGFCIRRATARGQAHWDGRIIQMDTRCLLLIAQRVNSNSMVRKPTGFHSIRLIRCLKVVARIKLAGRLVLPKTNDPVPIVVLVHGAERDSARDSYALQRLLPAENVGAFVYDKRGTGGSAGKYTQDFDTLADDAVAAMREAKRIAGRRCARIGYQGGSQGGWVAPIAATRAPVDFVIVSFGLAVSVIDEDQEEVALEMRLKGHSQEEISKALEVASAAEAVFESGFTKGFERLDAVRDKYRNEPWYRDLHGNYTHFILPYTAAEAREKFKNSLFGTPFRYDPMPTLRAVKTPQLWILGEDDLEAPSAETSRRIKTLIVEGKPITLALFPHAEHGMTEYEIASNGERVSTRYAPGYFAMMRDFARNGRLSGSYGSSTVVEPKTHSAVECR